MGWGAQLTFCLVGFSEVDMFPRDILSVLRSSTPTVRPNLVSEQNHVFVCVGFRCNSKQNKNTIIYLKKISIGVDLYTFVGARAPTMLSWAPPKVLWAPTTKIGTGITVPVL